jgi:hypothetical protein
VIASDLVEGSSYSLMAQQVSDTSFSGVDVGANFICGLRTDGAITCVGSAARIDEMP